jgi:hypothetical protein
MSVLAVNTRVRQLYIPILNLTFRGPCVVMYRGADKSLARPGRKQATATEDFEFHIPYL